MLSLVFALLYWAAAIYQFRAGSIAGGWATDLGEVHYLFGLYIASDAIGTTLLGLKKS